ncbi:MAG TPA: hypothetical protein VGJ09_02105, partial [Bryobacteraceae bacterium]
MKTFAFVLVALLALFAVIALPQQQGQNLTWAYPVPNTNPPPAGDPKEVKRLNGSSKSYTQAQIDDQLNPPDWFPQEHATLPGIVEHGFQVQACGSCHLMSGLGHPESANLAGLPVPYMLRQMEDFKNNLRKDPEPYANSVRAGRMAIIA